MFIICTTVVIKFVMRAVSIHNTTSLVLRVGLVVVMLVRVNDYDDDDDDDDGGGGGDDDDNDNDEEDDDDDIDEDSVMLNIYDVDERW